MLRRKLLSAGLIARKRGEIFRNISFAGKAHFKFAASESCLTCGTSPVDSHHLRFAQPLAIGLKVSDEFTVPLCRMRHSQNHRVGDEVDWWRAAGIEPLQAANKLWSISRGIADKS